MLCRRIRDLREDRDLKQQEIGAALGISQRTYSRYENAERTIPLDFLAALADYYETSVDYLMGRTDEKTPYPEGRRKPETRQTLR